MPTSTYLAESPTGSIVSPKSGDRFLTPMVSGAVTGGLIGIAWIVGGIIYLWNLWKSSRQARAAGLRSRRQLLVPPPKPDAFIIPPDPAIIQGAKVPGEEVLRNGAPFNHKISPEHVKLVPLVHRVEEDSGDYGFIMPEMAHSVSDPLPAELAPLSSRIGHDRPFINPSSPAHLGRRSRPSY
ncbi:hypothetical protein AcW1_008943 [Taiwanofungus camphoratus]|nr:hypothetical protein AcV5_006972 [Antrodia cinnamomea]KAI0930190.1 hypothetical protein AcV5_006972 [Antrodia cinnamomea]KAI0949280.1 hypothetical protein AcW1_008943 [Antrodia cinnamomea]KAI0949281.1 hypothetical protein AcW1_008943 [Antrodia cinnamomea]KAI0958895.1 hypothetical protein AcV7_004583 [Antrodia cinnamomea]